MCHTLCFLGIQVCFFVGIAQLFPPSRPRRGEDDRESWTASLLETSPVSRKKQKLRWKDGWWRQTEPKTQVLCCVHTSLRPTASSTTCHFSGVSVYLRWGCVYYAFCLSISTPPSVRVGCRVLKFHSTLARSLARTKTGRRRASEKYMCRCQIYIWVMDGYCCLFGETDKATLPSC